MIVRDERTGDEARIRQLVANAFAQAEHSSGTEPDIIDRLRAEKALSISLVAAEGEDIIGHVAVSPVTISSAAESWFGLGPVAVTPARQRQGIGGALIDAALERLRASGAAGCVVLGEPDYYGRFGFRHDPAVNYDNVPPPYFQVLPFSGKRPTGTVHYHPALVER